jgi:hypothetical protein
MCFQKYILTEFPTSLAVRKSGAHIRVGRRGKVHEERKEEGKGAFPLFPREGEGKDHMSITTLYNMVPF